MSTQQPPLRPGDRLSVAEARFLQTRDRILARRNPELLGRERAEFEAMTDEELAAIARLPPQPQIGEGCAMGTDGFGEISFADRYGTDVKEAAMGRLCAPARRGTFSDELWLKWCELDRLIGEADEKAHKEAAGVSALYETRRDELLAPIFDRLDEVEEQIANMVPTTIGDCLIQLRLLKVRWACESSELDDRLVANLLAGVEMMATAGS